MCTDIFMCEDREARGRELEFEFDRTEKRGGVRDDRKSRGGGRGVRVQVQVRYDFERTKSAGTWSVRRGNLSLRGPRGEGGMFEFEVELEFEFEFGRTEGGIRVRIRVRIQEG